MERVTEVIAPVAEDMGYDLVRVRLTGGQRARLQIMAERSDGTMTIDDCEALSRAVSAALDVADPIRSEYVLEVSSPGLDRPLVRRRDFEKFQGQEAKIELTEMQEGRRRFRGALDGVEADAVLLRDETGAVVRLPFATIAEARLVLTDALIAATLKAQKKAAQAVGQAAGQAADGVEMEIDSLAGRRLSKGQSNNGRRAGKAPAAHVKTE